jgi:hypothetical protein
MRGSISLQFRQALIAMIQLMCKLATLQLRQSFVTLQLKPALAIQLSCISFLERIYLGVSACDSGFFLSTPACTTSISLVLLDD